MESRAGGDLVYRSPSGDYSGSLLVGIPSRYLTVDLALGGGLHRFMFVPQGAAETRPRLVPDVTYRYLRGGLEMRLYTGSPVVLLASGHYRHVIDAGGIASKDWFPSLHVMGFEGAFGLSYGFLGFLELRLQGDLRLYRYQLNARRGDPHLADGAVDEYWSAWLGLGARWGHAPRR